MGYSGGDVWSIPPNMLKPGAWQIFEK